LSSQDATEPEQLVLDVLKAAVPLGKHEQRLPGQLLDPVDQVQRPGPAQDDNVTQHPQANPTHLAAEQGLEHLLTDLLGCRGIGEAPPDRRLLPEHGRDSTKVPTHALAVLSICP
jgi:hypothetical protein